MKILALVVMAAVLGGCNERSESEQRAAERTMDDRKNTVIKRNPGRIPPGCEVLVLDVPGSWLYALVCDGRPSVSTVRSYSSGKTTSYSTSIWVGEKQ